MIYICYAWAMHRAILDTAGHFDGCVNDVSLFLFS